MKQAGNHENILRNNSFFLDVYKIVDVDRKYKKKEFIIQCDKTAVNEDNNYRYEIF